MRLAHIIPNKNIPYQQNLKPVTLRGFSGGWNVLDDDMNLTHKFATRSDNVYWDGTSMRVRYGTKLFADLNPYMSSVGYPVAVAYFNGALIFVITNGDILKVMGDGSVSRIWDATIAATRPGAPSGWSTTDFASFADFNAHLIICNGIDKPLDIDHWFNVEYLQDAATQTNINVPICKYVVAFNRYLVMAGDPLEADRVHISAKDAPGTWFGDPPPNNATRIDVGSVLPHATVIRGLSALRGRLVVMFIEGLIFAVLGTEDENGNHIPNFDDGISGFGSISHHSAIVYGDDGLFMDLKGVPSIKRTALSTSFKPERVSALIDQEIRTALYHLSFEAAENRIFSVYNRAEGQFLMFVPNYETVEGTTETVAFVYNYRPQLGIENWSRFRGWNFTCGTNSLYDSVFFGDKNGKVWLYGSYDEYLYTDYLDYISPTPDLVGVGIEYDWELPWLDFGVRSKNKTSKHISFDTKGESEFLVRMYVDEFTEVQGVDSPQLAMEFSGGRQGGFGHGPQPYGGGRNSSVKKLIAWPAKFQVAKLRFSGTADDGWSLTSITVHYLLGGINR